MQKGDDFFDFLHSTAWVEDNKMTERNRLPMQKERRNYLGSLSHLGVGIDFGWEIKRSVSYLLLHLK